MDQSDPIRVIGTDHHALRRPTRVSPKPPASPASARGALSGRPAGDEPSSSTSGLPDVRLERLRDGFHLVVAEQGGPLPPPSAGWPGPDGGALALLCPLGQGRDGTVLLTATDGPLPPAGDGGAVVVVIATALLRTILAADFQRLPPRVAALLPGTGPAPGGDGPARPHPRHILPRTVEMTLAAQAIRGCPHQGAIRNMFLKSKALEMLALAFGSLKAETGGRGAVPLPARDVRALTRAHDLLLSRLDDPPTLSELAAAAGMCETRLKTGFRALFGDTPGGVRNRARMALARDMLVGRRCRVSEAAVAVGYTNVSHFIDAFVREFGVRPGHLARLVGSWE
ncbi:MAG: helix-turn-helix transcriptional regulator [Telmatospirillum sp.]|nr:helix-turn-helix transcriptional regulator [Telmatospirillum sp.]